MAGRDLGELVQTIIVAPANHGETVWCAAAAAGDAVQTLPGPWEEWLSGPSTKTDRRVKTAEQLDKGCCGHGSRRASGSHRRLRPHRLAYGELVLPWRVSPGRISSARIVGSDRELRRRLADGCPAQACADSGR